MSARSHGWFAAVARVVVAATVAGSLQIAGAPPVRAALHMDAPVSAAAAATNNCDSTAAPTTTVYLPNITKTLGGPLGWDTPFYVQDAGAVQTDIEVSFFRFSDGLLMACRKTVGIPPGASVLDDPNTDTDLPGDTQFSVVVKSFGAPIVATVNQLQGSGATTQALSYSGFTTGATKVYLPNVTRRFYGYDVPFIVQNLGVAATLVTASFISFDGLQRFTTSFTVNPGRSGVVDPDFTPGLTDGTQYAVTVTAGQPIGVVVNAHNEQIGPVAFSHNGLAAGGTTLYAPYAAKIQNGMFSPVVVQNVGAVAADATLTFTPMAGAGAPQVFTLKAIAAGASQAFDPRFALGTTTPCALAGPTCLGPGEYSLKITSPTAMAAVVLPNSPTIAAGYLAEAAPQTRSLLPAVMRTVGGPAGWTTLVYVLPVGAAQATVRYYALATGALAVTQTVPLALGGTKIDPRTVAGLQENTQYAMTIDGNGTMLAAIAHEQGLGGGDASMIYEGFPAPSLPLAPQPGSIRLQPGSATVLGGATQQFTGVVNDQFGASLPFGPIWSVTPPTLGTVTPSGLFTAGSSSGTGLVTVTAGAISASATVTVQSSTTIGGLTFRIVTSANADLYVETAISAADTATLAGLVEPAIAYIQTDFARTYTSRAQLYAFGSDASVIAGWSSVLGATGPATTTWNGIFVSDGVTSRIGLNWSLMTRQGKPYRTVQHELTHKMEHQLARTFGFPSWFDEGLARFEDLSVPGGQYRIVDSRASVVSMITTGTLLNVSSLTDLQFYGLLTSAASQYAYYEGAETVRLLRSDLTQAGLVRILEGVGAGQPFEVAYATVSGQPFTTFLAARNARLAALAPPRGILTAPDEPLGPGLWIEVYGLTPSTTVSVAITGASVGGTYVRNVDPFGVSFMFLDTTWPAGTYTITAVDGAVTLTSVVVKTSSVPGMDVLSIDPGRQAMPALPEVVTLPAE